ncbi:MAG: leucyl/phenylalanyl-tRNA--protein transferase [Oligoflexales bacterium]
MKRYTLNPELLHAAYSQGYFPMPDGDSGEILWFRPDPRAIIPLNGFHTSRSLRRTINRSVFKITYNQAFTQVMQGCAEHPETWINDEFLDVYAQMHKLGLAHSVEVWFEQELVGGTYGVCLGGAFFAESKFHRKTNASKVALYYLVKHMFEKGLTLLECQFLTPHLKSLGAIEVSDYEYLKLLKTALKIDVSFT